ncbi:MAG: acyl-CoA dehydrogenase family protein [bacterium]
MNFKLSTESEDFRKSVKTFCEKEIAPYADKLDREEMGAHEHFKKMGDMGILGITFPSEYGGSDADLITYAVGAEELSVACASTSLAVNASTTLAGEPINHFGTDEQKKKYLTGVTSGEMVGCFGLTEPGCGSDAAALQTFAEKKNGGYVLNGTKMFITNGPVADFAIVIARTSKEGGPKGISAFVVDKGTKGFSAGKPINKMGVRGSSTSELIFEDCKIPAENLLGKEGEGFKIAMQTLEYARISISCFCLGIARAAMEDSIAYAETRMAFGKPIGAFQSVNHKIADMRMYTETARNLIYHAAWLKQEGHPEANVMISIAKLFASEKATRIVNDAVQIHGGYGYSREYRVERLYRDVKLGEIGEGTSEVQRMIIAKHLLKD